MDKSFRKKSYSGRKHIIMGLLSAAVSILRFLVRDPNYRVVSERWFDDVWDCLRDVSEAKGEIYEKGGKVYRRLVVKLDYGRHITITDDEDEGAKADDVKLSWWERTRLEYSGSTVLKRYNE